MAGGMCSKAVCVAGACMAGGMHGRRDGHCSGRYASYWNAFSSYKMLLFFVSMVVVVEHLIIIA